MVNDSSRAVRSENRLDLKRYLEERKTAVDRAIRDYLPEPRGPASELIKAMRYSLLAGGKRLRPILCLAGAEAVGGAWRDAMPVACALEFIHSYSLIHDDLPVMDDDALRRGVPTNHMVYGEAMALLAGDGLLTEAFRLLSAEETVSGISERRILRVIRLIARASGYQGMVGGQAVDIRSEGRSLDLETLRYMHACKTGALITASVTVGALLGGGDEHQVAALRSYGERIGLAFQIADDILDVEGDAEMMGKAAGSDQRKEKSTYPAVVGLHESKSLQAQLVQSAIDFLEPFDVKADPLRLIAKYIIERNK